MRDEKSKKSINSSNHLLSLPSEILFHCLNFITSPKDLVSVSKTNRKLHEFALEQSLWQKFEFQNRFTKPKLRVIPLKKKCITAIAILSIGYMISSDSKYFYLWDTDTFKQLARKRAKPKITAICALPDGEFASGHTNSNIKIWAVKMGTTAGVQDFIIYKKRKLDNKKYCYKDFDCPGIKSLALLPNGDLVSSSCIHGIIRIWDLNTGKSERGFGVARGKGTITHMAVLLDGNVVTGVKSDNGNYFDVRSASIGMLHIQEIPVKDTQVEIGEICALAALPDGNFVSATSGRQNLIRIWELPSGNCIKVLTGQLTVNSLGLLNSGHLYSWSLRGWYSRNRSGGHIFFWNTSTGKCLHKQMIRTGNKGEVVGDIAVLNDGRLVCGSSHVGFYIFSFPVEPENHLTRLPSQKDQISSSKNCV